MKFIRCHEATKALSKSEEDGLILSAQVGNAEAWVKLHKIHRNCIRRVAKLNKCGSLDLDELSQEGWFAFHEAMREFDVTRYTQNRLWTYAFYSVKGAVIKLCAEHLGLSDAARRAYIRILETWDQLAQELGREPTAEDIVKKSEEDVSKKSNGKGKPLRLDMIREVLETSGRVTPLPPVSVLAHPSQRPEPAPPYWQISDSWGTIDAILRIVETWDQLAQEWKRNRKPTAEDVFKKIMVKGKPLRLDVVREVLGATGRVVSFPPDFDPPAPAPVDWLKDSLDTTTAILGESDGPKWAILFLLKEHLHYQWPEIVVLLGKGCHSKRQEQWAKLHPGKSLPDLQGQWLELGMERFSDTIPAQWDDVCALFQSDTLTVNAVKKSYSRKKETLLSKRSPDFPET